MASIRQSDAIHTTIRLNDISFDTATLNRKNERMCLAVRSAASLPSKFPRDYDEAVCPPSAFSAPTTHKDSL